MKVRLTALTALTCFTIATGLVARDAPRSTRVALLLPACSPPGLTASDLRDALSLDLRDEGLTLAAAGEFAPGDALVRVETACPADAELTLRIELENQSYTRRVDLREVPLEQRARALSLSLAELLALAKQGKLPPSPAEQAPATPEPPPEAPAPAPPPPAAAPAPAPAPTPAPAPQPTAAAPPASPAPHAQDREGATTASASDWQLALAPELRFFQTTTLWGGRALGHYRAWCASADILRARQSTTSGAVTTYLVHVSLGYHFTLLRDNDRSLLEAGPRVGAGRTFMNAESNGTARASDAQDLYLDAAFGARYAFRLSSAFRVGVGAELGYARGPIGYADDAPLARTAGTFASLLVDGTLLL